MRTIDRAIDELKRVDPGCALTKTALRTLVITGRIPSVNVGAGKGAGKYLISMEVLEEYLQNPPMPVEPEQFGKIRRIS